MFSPKHMTRPWGRGRLLIFLGIAQSLGTYPLHAQANPNLYRALEWRGIGPYRGGRVTAVTGVASDRFVYYMGATGGGVWKTIDGGISWRPLSDGYFKTGSVGAIAVADSDPNIIYVGMGEACLRANISHGDGVYKSTDAGKSWVNVGLRDTQQIGKVRIDPRNPDVVYVAAVGHPYGPNEERGVFRSRDGGKSWQRVLYINERTGAVDLAPDPHDPLTIYATTWQVLRTPWGITSTGPGAGIYKTTDGGDTWTQLKNGLPKGDKGKIGIAVSPVNPNRIWATVEAEDGGIYRSDDAGMSWSLLNDRFEVRSRQYYYGHIFADPLQADTVYTFSSKNFLKSIDGGKTYKSVETPHGDYHDLWIDPHDNQRMIDGDDGGADISFDGGKSWSSEMNQATAQFYTVSTDNDFPYHVYGAQQDNTTVAIASRTGGSGIEVTDWYEVGGGESGYVVPDPQNPNVVYAGAFWGLLTRYDHRTRALRNISVWPDLPGGRTAAEMKYRFQWTYPIAISPANPGAVYVGANVLFRSVNRGQSWEEISPDLTRDAKTRESEGRLEDVYSTIFAIAPSPVEKGVIWTGSDDGLIHLTKDGGKTWTNVTPPSIQPWTRINIIEASPHDARTAYVAANRYQLNDFRPYVYRTHDFGKTWTLVTSGIPEDTFVRSVRQDRVRADLLYAGTETGVYVSFDDGAHWQSLQQNLPVVPITDLTLQENDLVASTQGRSFWILDDVTPLQQITAQVQASKVYLFHPRAAHRVRRREFFRSRPGIGQNPPSGVIVYYYLAQPPAHAVSLAFQDKSGKTIEEFSSTSKSPRETRNRVSTETGLNRFVWDMRYPDATAIDGGTYFLGGSLKGPEVAPGNYTVKLTVDAESFTQSFDIQKDPHLQTTEDDYRRQFQLSLAVRDKLSATHAAINEIRRIQKDVDSSLHSVKADSSITDAGGKLNDALGAVLQKLVELRFTGFDDQTLVFPLQLNNRLAALQRYLAGDDAPTDQDYKVFKELSAEIDQALATLKKIMQIDVPGFNSRLKAQGLPTIASAPAAE
jgi:photosystem II stability/assembly factor-like uncharacterized protein